VTLNRGAVEAPIRCHRYVIERAKDPVAPDVASV
jgi:hypothetical protein